MNSSGAPGGPQQFVVPPLTATTALNLRGTFQLPIGFTTLSTLFGNATLTDAKVMVIVPVGTTVCTCYLGTPAATPAGLNGPIQRDALPAIVSPTLTGAVGLSLTAANTYEIFIF